MRYSPLQEEYNRVAVEMNLGFSSEWIFPLDYAVREPDDLVAMIKSSTSTGGKSKEVLELEIAVPDSKREEKFVLEIFDDTGHSQDLHIKFPSASDLQLIDLLTWEEVPIKAIELLEERYISKVESHDSESIFQFIDIAPLALDVESYFNLLNTLSRHIGWFRSEMSKNIHDVFKYLIRGEGIGKYYGPTTLSDLREIFEIYNNQPDLRDYSFNEFVGVLIADQVTDKRRRSEVKFLSDSGANPDFPLHSLSTRQYLILLSMFINGDGLESMRMVLATHYVGENEVQDFSEAVDSAGDIRDYEDRANAFADLLGPASVEEESPFRYILANALFWYCRYLMTHPEDHKNTRETILKAVITITEGTTFEWIHDWARFEINWVRGAKIVRKNPEQASDHFRKAVILATDTSNAWNNSRYRHLVPALGRQTEAEIDALRDEDRYEAAIELLNERKKLFSELEDVAEEQKSHWITVLEGYAAEVEAITHFEKYQFELALESFNRAAGAFNKAGYDALFDGVVGRQYQIQALLAEVEGDFDEAADLHEKYVDTLPDAAGAPYHRARQVVCEAKNLLLDDEFADAKSKIEEFRASGARLNPAQERFSLLIDASLDYRRETISDISNVVDGILSGVDQDIDTLIKFSDDYTTGFLTVLAAQRLRDLPVPGEFLDELVQLALEEACFPQNAAEMGAEPSYSRNRLRRLSLDTEWRLVLPRYVLDELEKVRTAKQTTFDDFSNLARNLVVPLEQHLAVFVEYHGKRFWGNDWKDEIAADEPYSLGDYTQFFNSEETRALPCYNHVSDILETGVTADKPLVQLRNALGHGRNPGISEEGSIMVGGSQFENLHESVTTLMEAMSTDTPVLATVENSFGDSYKIRLHWANYIKRTWVTSDIDLDRNELYYLSPEQITQENAHLGREDAIECMEERARSHILPMGSS